MGINEAVKKFNLNKEFTSAVRDWVKSGCEGPIISSNTVKTSKKKSKSMISVKCLGDHDIPYYFMSESKFVRLCPICSNNRDIISSSGLYT